MARLGPFLALLLFAPLRGYADTPGFVFVIQDELGTALIHAAQGDPPVGRVIAAPSGAVCADQPADLPRLALVTGTPRPLDLDACRQKSTSDVLAITIGYQAIALVAPANARAFSLPAIALFHAVGAHADARIAPKLWRDVDPSLPALPLGLLAPADATATSRLLNTYVMEPACSADDGARVPFEATRRIAFCGTLRADPAIVQRKGDDQEITAWAASAPAGQLAVLTLAELRRFDRVVVPLPLDGVLPTAANITSGAYPAAEPTTLLIVMPHDLSPARRDATRRAVFELLSERNVGPDGNLARAGLMPLSPTERVAARLQAVAFVDHP
jgi:phosphate transport system substrate-binding protein